MKKINEEISKEVEKMGIRTYKAQTKWIEGSKIETEIRGFKVRIDEPIEFKGTNTAPNPVELLLAALGGCLVLAYRGYAPKFGVEIENIGVDLEGDMIPGGWIDEEGRDRRGFKEIRYKVKIDTKSPEEKVRELYQLAKGKCPVSDMLLNPTPVKGEVSIED